MDTNQDKKITAKIESANTNGDGTHKVSFMLDKELTAVSGQYLTFSFERDGKVFKHKHVLGNSYTKATTLEESVQLKSIEDELFTPVLKKDSVFIIEGPFDFTLSEKVSRLLLSGVNHKMLLVESLVIVLIAGSTIFFLIKNLGYQEKVQTPPVAKVFVPKKTDYGTTTPPGFPITLLIEKKATVTQSYTRDYSSQKQMSIVLFSPNTMNENFTLYQSSIKKDGWKIINLIEKKNMSILQGERGLDKIEITVIDKNLTSTSSVQKLTRSHIIINVFRK